MTQTRQARDGIQALRAIAFLMVLFQHVVYYAAAVKGLDYRPYLMIDFGQAGVLLFFTISGYVMGECLGQGWRFIWNRAVRIYPPFWLAILISWPLLNGTGEWSADLWSALLLPSTGLNNSYNIPYWTLCYEVAFYALVYVLILARLSRERVAMVCVGWLALIALTGAYKIGAPIRVHEPGWWILLSQESIFFVLGLFISTAGAGSLEKWSGAQLALVGVLVWAIFQPQLAGLQVPAMAGSAAACALILLAAQRLRFPRALVRIGDLSYGGYLMHMVLVTAVVRHFFTELAQMRLLAVLAILGVVAVVGGLAYGWSEFQMHNRIFRKLFRTGHAPTQEVRATVIPDRAELQVEHLAKYREA